MSTTVRICEDLAALVEASRVGDKDSSLDASAAREEGLRRSRFISDKTAPG
ncbi:MAG: hypothetical protein MI723_14905 [Caulobacterales bacterium]|nr:hypothetical protein [Caulobacterales bacterium]